jgi:hypothetical protein
MHRDQLSRAVSGHVSFSLPSEASGVGSGATWMDSAGPMMKVVMARDVKQLLMSMVGVVMRRVNPIGGVSAHVAY